MIRGKQYIFVPCVYACLLSIFLACAPVCNGKLNLLFLGVRVRFLRIEIVVQVQSVFQIEILLSKSDKLEQYSQYNS